MPIDTLFSDVNAILVGIAGKTDMLRAVFGSKEPEPDVENLPIAGPGIFSRKQP